MFEGIERDIFCLNQFLTAVDWFEPISKITNEKKDKALV